MCSAKAQDNVVLPEPSTPSNTKSLPVATMAHLFRPEGAVFTLFVVWTEIGAVGLAAECWSEA